MAASRHAEAGKQSTPKPVTPARVGADKEQAAATFQGDRIDPRGLTPQAILALQRTAGNRAVNILLQRYATAPLVMQRKDEDAITIDMDDPTEQIGPSQTTAHDTQSYQTEPIRKQARKDSIERLDMFANLWLTAATTALAGAPEAEDTESNANWFIALGGNLLWAATSFVDPAMQSTIRVMSVVGASAGSGVFNVNENKAPSGKEFIGGMLTKARDQLTRNAGPLLDQVATKCGDQQITDSEEQRKVLWRHLFKTGYNESDPIREEMTIKIEARLAEYLQQWHAWKQAHARHRMHGARGDDAKRDQQIQKLRPFRPYLNFGE